MDTSHLKKALSFIPHPLIVNIDDFCWLLKWEISKKKVEKQSCLSRNVREREENLSFRSTSQWGLLWAKACPPSKFPWNPCGRFCVILQTNPHTTNKPHKWTWAKNITLLTEVQIIWNSGKLAGSSENLLLRVLPKIISPYSNLLTTRPFIIQGRFTL